MFDTDSLIETDDEVQRAADRVAELEKLLLKAGGIAGPGTIGDPYAEPQPTEVTA